MSFKEIFLFTLLTLCKIEFQFAQNSPLAIKVCYKDNKCSLTANGNTFACQIGYNGVVDGGKKYEGDGMTPTGIYHLTKAYYRADRLTQDQINSIKMDKEEIQPWSTWCDDTNYPWIYNSFVDARMYNNKPPYHYENLTLSSELYDLFYVIDYNLYHRALGLGSAIFFHISNSSTAGCVALERDHMFSLVPFIVPGSKIYIDMDFCN